MIEPSAMYDTLAVSSHVVGVLDSITYTEIHLFSYLSCLLSLYEKQPVSDWDYRFAGTRGGAPFSYELDRAVNTALHAGYLAEAALGETSYKPTPAGEAEHLALSSLPSMRRRERYIHGACASVLALPVGTIRTALTQEPELSRTDVGATDLLLDEGPGMRRLYEQFSALSERVGVNTGDLMLPAVVWISYLSKIAEKKALSSAG